MSMSLRLSATGSTRALIESNAREATDLVAQLTLLLDHLESEPENLVSARIVTRRLSDRLAQAGTLERLTGSGGCHPDAWSPIEVIEEIDRFKRESSDRGQNARSVSRMLDGLRAHGRLSEAQRQAAGIGQGLIRLSVGLEHVDDIIDDLLRGLSTLNH